MRKIPFKTIEKILLDLPKSSKNLVFSTVDDTVFKIDNVIVVISNKGLFLDHLIEVLESQLGMSWWMIDYVLGENDLQSG